MKKSTVMKIVCPLLASLFVLSACNPANIATTTDEPDTTSPETEKYIPDDLVYLDLSFEDPIVWLNVGETYTPNVIREDKYAVITATGLSCNADDVVKIENGTITALSSGNVTVHAENPYNGKVSSVDLLIRVISVENDPTVIVCAPVWNVSFMDDKQMTLIRDAGFTHINLMNGNQSYGDVRYAFKMCEKYGIGLFPGLSSPDLYETDMTREQIAERIALFKEYKTFCGFYLQDEPGSGFAAYARAAQMVYELDPTLTCMINFLPSAEYDAVTNFAAQLYDNDYKGVISMDNYVFGKTAGSVDEFWLFRNFEMYRDIGLKNRARTGFYLQAIGSDYYGYRRPDEGTLFYHSMLGLAYGFTIMRYFSYLTPNKQFTDGIIGADLEATDTYPACCALNRKCVVYGRVLINANADEIYHTGSKLDNSADYKIVPDDYFITPQSSGPRTVLSVFTDRQTDSNYLMIVNKFFNKPITVTYNLKNVPYLYEVDENTGLLNKVDVSNGTLTVELSKGNARLYVLPYNIKYTADKPKSDNLLLGSYVAASSAHEATGYSTHYLTDGVTDSSKDVTGWRASEDTTEAWLYFELDNDETFNRIDLYPAGVGAACGRYFPDGMEVLVSDDGATWKSITKINFESASMKTGQTVKFDAVTSRYLKLLFTGLSRSGRKYVCDFAEICLFNDNGAIAAAAATSFKDAVNTPGTNVALNQSVCDCSSKQNTIEWRMHESYLTDGNRCTTGLDYRFCSAILSHNSSNGNEFVTVDLGNTYTIDKIVLYPHPNGDGFPRSYTVDISEDGENWTTVASVVRASPNRGKAVTHTFTPQKALFVRVNATQLTLETNPNAGYVLMLCELEAYTPS